MSRIHLPPIMSHGALEGHRGWGKNTESNWPWTKMTVRDIWTGDSTSSLPASKGGDECLNNQALFFPRKTENPKTWQFSCTEWPKPEGGEGLVGSPPTQVRGSDNTHRPSRRRPNRFGTSGQNRSWPLHHYEARWWNKSQVNMVQLPWL